MEQYYKEELREFIVLEPEDWTEEEWKTITKIFASNYKSVSRIKLSNVTLETFGEKEEEISEEEWKKATENLNSVILMYSSIGPVGMFGLSMLSGLKTRYENGERTKDLYESMMSAE